MIKTLYFHSLTTLKLLTVWITTNYGKFFKYGNTRPLTCLLRHLYAGQEAAVSTRHRTIDWFQTGKGVHQGSILSPCFLNLYAEYIMWNARLDEAAAATAAKSLQSCPTLCDPIDGSPPGSAIPGKNTGVGCHFLLQCMKWKVKGKSLSRVRLLATPWTAAYQAPPSVRFFQARVLEWVPLPSPGWSTSWN